MIVNPRSIPASRVSLSARIFGLFSRTSSLRVRSLGAILRVLRLESGFVSAILFRKNILTVRVKDLEQVFI